jgi:hexosaminidase
MIPAPLKYTKLQGCFYLNNETTIFIPSSEIASLVSTFASKLKQSTGFSFPITNIQNDNSIGFLIDNSLDVNSEGYILEISQTLAEIRSKTYQGLFYGFQTFLQLLPPEVERFSDLSQDIEWFVPSVFIKDEPRFPYRGIILDTCRHFMPIEFIKKQIDIFALFKINRLHLHLTDDQGWRFEIKCYPKLTENDSNSFNGNNFYTQEDIRGIVQYAKERFISVIPEMEMPEHELASISAYPELSCSGEPISPRTVWELKRSFFVLERKLLLNFLKM